MGKRQNLIIFAFLFLIQAAAIDKGIAADGVNLNSFISFSEAEDIAIKNSHLLASQKYTVESARAKTFAQEVKRLPTLDLGASSTFQSKIGSISIPQLGIERTVGNRINWSVGPVVNWVVWDTGQIINKARSLKKITDAETENLENDRRQVLLNARTAYINVQLAKEQVMLVLDALKLARAQYDDVLNKKNAGTADLLDLTVAHQEMVDREKDLEEANGELVITKKALVAALGFEPESEQSDLLDVESIGKVLGVLLPKADVYVDIMEHPQVLALEDQKLSAEFAARSISGRHWPDVTLQGKSTFEYPNLGINETIQQNKLMLGLSLPILDWGKISKETKSEKYLAHSAKEQKNQTIVDLSRTTAQTREKIQTCKELRVANAKVVKDAVEVARLMYDSYNAGRVIFLDVQRTNVKALSAKVDAARNDANLAVQIANLLALAEGEGKGGSDD